MKNFLYAIISCFWCCVTSAEVKKVELIPTEEMTRAEAFLWKPTGEISAVLIYCPGHNGVGRWFAENREWQEFAQANKIALCGLSFASEYDKYTAQWKGYSHAERGAGDLILGLIDVEFGRDVPIFIYGYSAGARLTASFVNWRPDRVRSWFASGVARWPREVIEQGKNGPYGIIACGEYDGVCYWSSLNYFQLGRRSGKNWSWLSLKKMGHGHSTVLDKFVRMEITRSLSETSNKVEGVFYDIDTKNVVSEDKLKLYPAFASWVPKYKPLEILWKEHHTP